MHVTRKSFNWVHENIKSYEDIGPLEDIELYFMRELKKAHKQRLNVLDLGCGYGRLGLRLATQGHHVLGVDANQSSVDKFNKIASDNGFSAKAICEYVENFSIEENAWDIIIAVSIMHLVPRHLGEVVFQQILKGTRNNGINLIFLFLQEPNLLSEKNRNYWYFPESGFLQDLYLKNHWKILHCVEKSKKTQGMGIKKVVGLLVENEAGKIDLALV